MEITALLATLCLTLNTIEAPTSIGYHYTYIEEASYVSERIEIIEATFFDDEDEDIEGVIEIELVETLDDKNETTPDTTIRENTPTTVKAEITQAEQVNDDIDELK